MLHSEHPCLLLPDRGSNYTLPRTLQINSVIEEPDVRISIGVLSSLRGSYPDGCLDAVKHTLCIIVAPPCDPNSNGLPMQYCEQDCVGYKMLKEEGACDSLVEFILDYAKSVGSFDLIRGVDFFDKFDCSNVTSYYVFESESYAETCTGLLSKQTRGKL